MELHGASQIIMTDDNSERRRGDEGRAVCPARHSWGPRNPLRRRGHLLSRGRRPARGGAGGVTGHTDHPVTVVKWCHQQDAAPRVPRETGSYVSRLVRAFRPSGNPTCYTNSCLDLSVSGHGAFCQNLLPPGGACLDSHH